MLHAQKMSSIPTRVQHTHQSEYVRREPGMQGGHSPSKLQLMQLQMQQKHMLEKEQKMIEYQHQQNTYNALESNYPSGEDQGSVRRFFQERRDLGENGYTHNISHHYKQVKQGGTYQYQASAQPQGQPQSQVRSYGAMHEQRVLKYNGRPPLPVKNSAGRDKSNPLAPIERTPKQTPHGSRQSSRRSSANSRGTGFSGKPRITRHRREPNNDQVPYESENENNVDAMTSTRSEDQRKKSTNFRDWQEKQKRKRQASAGQDNQDSVPVEHFGSTNEPGSDKKLSDFDKWQLEQDQQKQDRLKNYRDKNGLISNRSGTSDRSPQGRALNSGPTHNNNKVQQKKGVLNNRVNARRHLFPSDSKDFDDDEVGGGEVDDEVAQKQRELEEMIRRQQAELTKIQRDREAEEEKERREAALRQKRAAEQRERQHKQREAEERERRQAADRERKAQIEDDRMAHGNNKNSSHGPYENEDSDTEPQEPAPFPRKASRPAPHRAARKQEATPPPPPQPAKRANNRGPAPPQKRAPSPQLPAKSQYQPEPNPRDDGVAFYLQVAEQAESERLDMAACKVCGRKFARDRLDRHVEACKKASQKKRKVFDPAMMRTEGTEMAQYQKQRNRKEPKPKPQQAGLSETGAEHWCSSCLYMPPDYPFHSYRSMDLSVSSNSIESHSSTNSLLEPPPPPCYPMEHQHINSATDLIGHSAATMLNQGLDSLSDFSDEFSPSMTLNNRLSPLHLCGSTVNTPQSLPQNATKDEIQEYEFTGSDYGPVGMNNENGDCEDVKPLKCEISGADDGVKASRKTNPHQLPLCKVCNAQATGFHYGVNSCEACKGFFHRSLLRRKPYKCYKSAKCEIRPGKRNVCGQCRYKRCLEVGMSKEGIKTGRYTYEKRTKDILEIKKDHLQKADAIEKELEHERQSKLEAFISRLVVAKERLLSDVDVVQQTDIGVTAVHKEAPDKLMYIPYEPPEPFEEGSNIWRKWASVVENTGGVRRVIKFVKTIPGFRELEMSDQIQLIKHSFCEIWLIARHKFFDTGEKVYRNKVGFSFDVVKAIGEEEAGTLLNVSKRLKLLDLGDEEAALMVAFVIFFSDRCPLIEPEEVDQIQNTILEALTFVLHRDHADDKTRFGKIMSTFIELRSMTELYHSLSDRALSNIGDIAPLLWEIINLS